MSPGGQRPAGTDGADKYACACTCGYRDTLNRYRATCPIDEDDESPRVHSFTCRKVDE